MTTFGQNWAILFPKILATVIRHFSFLTGLRRSVDIVPQRQPVHGERRRPQHVAVQVSSKTSSSVTRDQCYDLENIFAGKNG
jgi:hypothetical protein